MIVLPLNGIRITHIQDTHHLKMDSRERKDLENTIEKFQSISMDQDLEMINSCTMPSRIMLTRVLPMKVNQLANSIITRHLPDTTQKKFWKLT